MQNYKKLSERAFLFHQKGMLKEAEELYSGLLEINPDAVMVIKSTIPVGYVKEIREKFKTDNILFSP